MRQPIILAGEPPLIGVETDVGLTWREGEVHVIDGVRGQQMKPVLDDGEILLETINGGMMIVRTRS